MNESIACASCHRQELAFTDGKRLSPGATGEMTKRNAMSLTNVAYNGVFTWADNTYAIAGSAYNTAETFASQLATENALTPIASSLGASHTYLQKADLSTAQALMPATTAHLVWSSLACATHLGPLPFHVRAGISGNVAGNSWLGRAFSAWASAQLTF